jgi:hypothetical protein
VSTAEQWLSGVEVDTLQAFVGVKVVVEALCYNPEGAEFETR